LIFKGTARNFNARMAGAAKITIAEGRVNFTCRFLDPTKFTSGNYRHNAFQGEKFENELSKRTVKKEINYVISKEEIAKRM
jgi:3-oxoacid CoA-transferase subunit A